MHRAPWERGSSLEERARQHPDFAKWDEAANERDGDLAPEYDAAEDAMERTSSPEEEACMTWAMIYWIERVLEGDANGYDNEGDHIRRAKQLASKYGIDEGIALAIFNSAADKIGSFAADARINSRDTYAFQDEMRREGENLVEKLRSQERELFDRRAAA